MELVLLAAMAFLVFALLGRVGGARHQAAVAGGQRVRDQLDTLYAGEHDYARVTPAAFPDADLAFYDGAGAELEALGFRRIADIEDLTVSRVYPEQRTFIRVLADEGCVVRAGVYHFRPRGGLIWLLQMLRQVPRHVRVVELVSEVPTGRFLSTSNTKGIDRLEPPPEVRVERLEASTSVATLVTRHRERLQQQVRAQPDRVPSQFVSYEDVLASVQRGNQVAARWRQKVGRLTREELERMQGGRPLNDAEEAFLREVQGKPERPAPERPVEPPPRRPATDDEHLN
jgi:hypothetical protein